MSYERIASSWHRWCEYFNADSPITLDEFEALHMRQRIALLEETFGPEDENDHEV